MLLNPKMVGSDDSLDSCPLRLSMKVNLMILDLTAHQTHICLGSTCS
jgi:hypothetical protein